MTTLQIRQERKRIQQAFDLTLASLDLLNRGDWRVMIDKNAPRRGWQVRPAMKQIGFGRSYLVGLDDLELKREIAKCVTYSIIDCYYRRRVDRLLVDPSLEPLDEAANEIARVAETVRLKQWQVRAVAEMRRRRQERLASVFRVQEQPIVDECELVDWVKEGF